MAEDKENKPADTPSGEESAPQTGPAESGAEAEGEQPAAGRGKLRGGRLLAVLALLVALGAAAAGGYAYWRLDQRMSGLSERLAATEQQDRAVQEALDGLRDDLQAAREARREIAGRADQLAEQTASVRKATQELFARIEGGPTYWRLERVESLLLAADRVVRLEHDPQAAYAALAEADRMLRELKDPAWLDVRQTIQATMTELEQAPQPDLPGIAFRLASLGEAALDLPLKRQQAPDLNRPPAEDAATEAEPQGVWGRIKAALGQFWTDIKGLVRLRRAGKDIEPLLPPDKAAFLRHNLVLNLQAARLAALRGEPKVYRQSLTAARDWVGRFFDGDSDEVAGMRGALDELADRRIAPELPKVEEPLRVFRQVRKERGS
jgi:uroporphyrin-3 C-methyltransferase